MQDSYALRCAPQVHGAVRDVLAHARGVIDIELGSVVDNPVIVPDGEVMSTGNFHGEPLAFAGDMLAIAVSELASISERRTDRMLDPAFSRDLPAFLAKDPGTNSGYMIAQYTAASLVSENKVLAHPGERRHDPDVGQPGGPRLDGLDLDAQAARGRRQRAFGAVRRDPGRLPGAGLPRRDRVAEPGWGRRARGGPPRRPDDGRRPQRRRPDRRGRRGAARRSSRQPRRQSVGWPSDEPLAWFGGRLATGLEEVSHDPAALDSGGWWAVVATFEGELTAARFSDVRDAPLPTGRVARRPGGGVDVVARPGGVRGGGCATCATQIAAGEVYQANVCRVLSAAVPDPGRMSSGLAHAPRGGQPGAVRRCRPAAVARRPGRDRLAGAVPAARR